MSFFNTSDNKPIVSSDTFDANASLPPIAAGTVLTCLICEAAWKEYQGEYNIKFKWTVLDGDYKGRKIMQTVKIEDQDVEKRDKAKLMFAAIDANCGGHLVQAGIKPTEDAMAVLLNKPMRIKVMVYDIDGQQGNWVSAVSSAQMTAQAQPNGAMQAQAPQVQQSPPADAFDDDMPF